MLNNIHKRGLSKQHTVKVNVFQARQQRLSWKKNEKALESKSDVLIVHPVPVIFRKI